MVEGTTGDANHAPPSMLYSTLNPATGVTAGNVKTEAQVLGGDVRTGTGNTTKFSLSGQKGDGVV